MAYDPDIIYRPESRALERTVRSACGALFGVIPGWWVVAELGLFEDLPVSVVIVGLSAMTCGYLAQRYGDVFWHKAAEVIRTIF